MHVRRMTELALGAALLLAVLAPSAPAGMTKCRLRYSLQGWSAFYESASGSGTITCDNGKSVHVSIRAKGGGVTFGKTKITNGRGDFSEVGSIDELFGAYAAAQANAGMVESANAQVMTKGTVSLALSGTGKGINLGVSFGEFVIERAGKSGNK
jgi:hypothetical protein